MDDWWCNIIFKGCLFHVIELLGILGFNIHSIHLNFYLISFALDHLILLTLELFRIHRWRLFDHKFLCILCKPRNPSCYVNRVWLRSQSYINIQVGLHWIRILHEFTSTSVISPKSSRCFSAITWELMVCNSWFAMYIWSHFMIITMVY